MGYKEVVLASDLRCETTVAIGGYNRKQGKVNPTQVEGYFLGSKQVPDKKKQSGFSLLHHFHTKDGLVGVWGKTDLDRKLSKIPKGFMTLAKFKEMKATPNGEMYVFSVGVDETLAYDGEIPSFDEGTTTTNNVGAKSTYSSEEDSEDEDGEDSPVDEVAPQRPVAPKVPVKTPTAAAAANLQGILNSRGGKKTA